MHNLALGSVRPPDSCTPLWTACSKLCSICILRGAEVCHFLFLKIAAFGCRSLVLKACPGYAQTEVQLMKQGDSIMVRHDKLCQPAHKAMCLAFALQAMSQKHMHSAAASSLHKPVSVHDAQAVQPSTNLAVAIVGEPFRGCKSMVVHVHCCSKRAL